jgi:hypothetical protein
MSRYKPGQSGNPKGRPRKPKSDRINIRAMIKEALNGNLTMRIGDKEARTTYLKAGLVQMATQFAKGDAKARRDVIWLAEKYGMNLLEGIDHEVDELQGADHRATLEAYIASLNGTEDVSASEPTIAPPDLQDDDKPDVDGS